MFKMHWHTWLGFAMLLALATGSPALADIANQGKVFEVWVGDYSPGASEFDSDLAYGIRFAYNNSERISFAGEAGYVSLSGVFVEGVTTAEVDDGGFTLQGGGALKIQLGKSFELRPAIRMRWFEARPEDNTDTEYLLGFGYRF